MSIKKAPDLKVFEQGSGQPVVLVHGLISTHRYRNRVVSELTGKSLRIIRPDLLGFGASPKPFKATYSLDEHADALWQALDSLKLNTKCILVGHSFGATVALHMAATRPEPIERLVLSALPFISPKSGHKQLSTIAEMPAWMARGKGSYVAASLLVLLKPILHWLLPLLTRKFPRDVVQDIMKLAPWSYARSIQTQLHSAIRPDIKALSIPTTLLLAKNDPLAADTSNYPELTNNQHIKVTWLGGEHQIPLHSPQMIAQAVLSV